MGWLWAGLGHVRRAAACPVWLPESAERSRAGGGYAISPAVLAATHPTVLVFCCVCLSLFGVCRDRIEAFGAFRVTDWAAASG